MITEKCLSDTVNLKQVEIMVNIRGAVIMKLK